MSQRCHKSCASSSLQTSSVGVPVVSLVLVDTDSKISATDGASLDSVAEVVMVSINRHPVQNVRVVAPQLAQLLLQLLNVAVEIRCFVSSAKLISRRLQYHDVSELLGPWPLHLQ